MDMNGILEAISEKAATPPKADDYYGEDGLLYCGCCHTKKQSRFECMNRTITVNVMCTCAKEAYDREEAERLQMQKIAAARRMKASCIHDRGLIECTFDTDDGSLPQIKSAKKYVETWPVRKANNDGLLLWGDVGCGKTFYAACIANALIDEGVSVLMTNFSKIINQLTFSMNLDKNEFIASMMKYSLLIIDDFGIERNTEYALEQVYSVIDERYKTKLPLIITTNLSLETLKNPPDTAHKRIYDRVLAMCVPVRFVGNNHRKADAEAKIRACRELF